MYVPNLGVKDLLRTEDINYSFKIELNLELNIQSDALLIEFGKSIKIVYATLKQAIIIIIART